MKIFTAEIAENAECMERTAVRSMHLLCELCALSGETVFCLLTTANTP